MVKKTQFYKTVNYSKNNISLGNKFNEFPKTTLKID